MGTGTADAREPALLRPKIVRAGGALPGIVK
jgi:hypothetical protein